MKKLLSSALCLSMVLGLSVPAFGYTIIDIDESTAFSPELIEQEKQMKEEAGSKTYNLPNGLTSFADIPSSFWAYDAIMEMTEVGLFAGTTVPVNGVGTFSPNATMSRAQFITVVTRHLFADELANAPSGLYWYEPNYNVAVDKGLIDVDMFATAQELNSGITREEMAYIITNALSMTEGVPTVLIPDSYVPDFNSVNDNYKDEVLACYTAGIICGVDLQGTFSPNTTVTRAQGAVILYRLIHPEIRNIPVVQKETKETLYISKQGTLEIGDFDCPEFVDFVDNVVIENNGKSATLASSYVRLADVLSIDEELYNCEDNERFIVVDFVGFNTNYDNFNIKDYNITLSDSYVVSNYETEYKEMGLDIYTHTNVEMGKYFSGYFIFKVPTEFINNTDVMRLNFYSNSKLETAPYIDIAGLN